MDALDRTFRHLVQTIQNQFPAYLDQPFEVAELYQTILPYRHHRRELGFETNQDYELVLLQLLAGARNYLIVDDRMREGLAHELASATPTAGAFREFNTAQVSLNPDAVQQITRDPGNATTAPTSTAASSRPADTAPDNRTSTTATTQRISVSRTRAAAGGAMLGSGSGPAASGMGDPASPTPARSASAPPPESRPKPPTTTAAAQSQSAQPLQAAAPRPPAATVAATPTPSRGSLSSRPASATTTGRNNTVLVQPGEQCRYCAGALPAGRRITFCPHCGQNLTVVNCMACGTELELGWKFCTTCGRPVTA